MLCGTAEEGVASPAAPKLSRADALSLNAIRSLQPERLEARGVPLGRQPRRHAGLPQQPQLRLT